MQPPPSIIWFRQDLRLSDNPALTYAATNSSVLCVYIHEAQDMHEDPTTTTGAASCWWLQRSLEKLNQALEGQLHCFHGNAAEILSDLAQQTGATDLYWNRRYTPQHLALDNHTQAQLEAQHIHVHHFNASLLSEPWQIHKPDGHPYKVFTPYSKRAQEQTHIPLPLNTPTLRLSNYTPSQAKTPKELALAVKQPWHDKLEQQWQVGEHAAKEQLSAFLRQRIAHYDSERDFPNSAATSSLSPYLHFGEISPQQIWHATQQHADAAHAAPFLRQLLWREFSYYQLYHFPALAHANLKPAFNNYPWRRDDKQLQQWQAGQTGIPIIDAGMRELWQTGTMHNRVRMLVASFLCKNLQIHWRYGADWFWDCLVDADLANNSASWQWVAGSGADAAPYFRIFNPETQSRKFDSQGHYIRQYCPELAKLDNKNIHAPWRCDKATLAAANIILDQNYPQPMVNLADSRAHALEGFHHMKELGDQPAAPSC